MLIGFGFQSNFHYNNVINTGVFFPFISLRNTQSNVNV